MTGRGWAGGHLPGAEPASLTGVAGTSGRTTRFSLATGTARRPAMEARRPDLAREDLRRRLQRLSSRRIADVNGAAQLSAGLCIPAAPTDQALGIVTRIHVRQTPTTGRPANIRGYVGSTPLPGAVTALRQLRAAGMPLALVSARLVESSAPELLGPRSWRSTAAGVQCAAAQQWP